MDSRMMAWLVLATALTLFPHLGHLPWWLIVLFVVTAGWRWQVVVQRQHLPQRWLLMTMTLLIAVAIFHDYKTLLGRDAGVALLGAMMSLKFLELRTRRDSMVILLLGYLLLMANLLYSQSILMAAYLLAILTVLLAAQMVIQHPNATLPWPVPIRLAGRMLMQSIPVMLILFMLFPRIPGPLWGLPKDAYSGFTGLSDEMEPGSISQLSQSGAVAFRVRFNGNLPPSEQLYWRGPVLWRYDGYVWKRSDEYPKSNFSYATQGNPVEYSVILEPHGKRWLFALDLPAALPAEAGITGSFQLLRKTPVNKVLRYETRSYLRYNTGALSDDWQRRAVYLPAGTNPRTRALAAQWQAQYSNPSKRVNRALKLFREQPFHYTLNPPRLKTENRIDEFLFDTRQGFCEHYASGFVFLMRAAGVPARVVTGYQGGELNALGDYLIVRQSDAHAWAEVWLQGQGWVRVDPTAAVAPERVERGLYAAVDGTEPVPFLARRDNPWIRHLALGWDSLNNAWNEWVLAYGPERQREFLSGLGFGPIDWRGMTAAMAVALGCLGGLYMGLYILRHRAGVDPVVSTYQRFCAKLARRGLTRDLHEGPLSFAERVAARRPDLAVRVRLISRLYAYLRYGRIYRREDIRRLQRLVRTFKI